MHPEQVKQWLTEARFDAYRLACAGDHDRAVELYNWNAAVSSAFFEVLHHVEVLVRNSIDRRFPASDPTQAVSICQPTVWLTDRTILTDESRLRVNEAIQRFVVQGQKTPTRARIVAALSFGFWRALFVRGYDDLWRTHLMPAFPNGNGKRREVEQLLASALHFRNRIAHHEAVFSYDLEHRHDRILRLCALVDADAREYVAGLSRVPALLISRP